MKYLKLFENIKKELEELSNKIDSFDLETQYKDVKEIQDFGYSKLKEVNKRKKEVRDKELYKKNKDILDKIDNILKNSTLKKIINEFNLKDTDNLKFNKKYENIIRRRTLPVIDRNIKLDIDELTIKYNIKGEDQNMSIYIRIEQIYDKNTNELSYKIFIGNFAAYDYYNKRVISLLSDLKKLEPIYFAINKEELYELLKKIKDIINEIDLELVLNQYNL